MSTFAVATTLTPLLNRSDFAHVFGGSDGLSLPFDQQGLNRAVEMVAFPGTKFEILDQLSDHVVCAFTHDYPYAPIYVDKRFLKEVNAREPERKISKPSREKLFGYFEKALGHTYIWGANCIEGVPELLHYYPPKNRVVQDNLLRHWQLQGVDCSGLLYEGTLGFTPRNTSSLLHFGQPVPIRNATIDQLCQTLQPLDLIVWKGHVIIVFDRQMTIESRLGFGVIKTDLADRLQELMVEKGMQPVDIWQDNPEHKQFVVRRWI